MPGQDPAFIPPTRGGFVHLFRPGSIRAVFSKTGGTSPRSASSGGAMSKLISRRCWKGLMHSSGTRECWTWWRF